MIDRTACIAFGLGVGVTDGSVKGLAICLGFILMGLLFGPSRRKRTDAEES